MEKLKGKAISCLKFIGYFGKWTFLAVITGIIGGALGSAFHIGIEYATQLREQHDWFIFLLLPGGLLIVFLYQICKMPIEFGTNLVIDSIRNGGKVPFRMAPLIFISTIITHLFGGSAGREGAALQLGGSVGSQVGWIFRLDEKDKQIAVLCGMSGMFSALFGTPLTATIFVIELISVGVFYYSAIIPCIVAAISAFFISELFGITPITYSLDTYSFDVVLVLKIILLAGFCALLSILLCVTLEKTARAANKYIKNPYIRIATGATIIIALTYFLGITNYNGAGLKAVGQAIETGVAMPQDFILKLIFTAVTIGVGFKGGEIVPTFFIGATFGCVVAPLIGIDPKLGAAVGLIALFCGATNTPIASIILSIELFGGGNLILFAVACAVSYMLSGYFSLYSSQVFIYSKIKSEYINKKAK